MAGLDDQTVFGVDFRAESDSDSAEHQESDARCKTWLARLPCPSVALVSGPLALQDGFDVVLECRDAYDRLSARIAAHPIAAMTLVQVLRLVEAIDIHSGLIVESLAFAEIGRAHVFTPVTNAHLVCRLLLAKQTPINKYISYISSK